LIGFVLSGIGYYITIPLVLAYQKARAAKAVERSEKRGRLRSALAAATQRIKPKLSRDGGDAHQDE
jgi:hypothetical protein